MDDVGGSQVMRDGLTQAMEFLLEMCNGFDILLESQLSRARRGKLVSTSTVRYATEAFISRRFWRAGLKKEPAINFCSHDENDSTYDPSEEGSDIDDDAEWDAVGIVNDDVDFDSNSTILTTTTTSGVYHRDARDDSVLFDADLDGLPFSFNSHVVLVYFRWHAEHSAPYEPLAITRNALRVFGLLLERWLHAFLEHRYPQYQRWNRRRYPVLGRTAILRGRILLEDSCTKNKHGNRERTSTTPPRQKTPRVKTSWISPSTSPSSRSLPFRGRTVRPRSSRSDSLLHFLATLPDTTFQQIILYL